MANRGRGLEGVAEIIEKVENRMIEGEFLDPLSLFPISCTCYLYFIIIIIIKRRTLAKSRTCTLRAICLNDKLKRVMIT